MNIRFLFHITLLVIFAGLSYTLLYQSQSNWRDEQAQQQQSYQRQLLASEGLYTGTELYDLLNQEVSFQFFQFIHTEDSTKNFSFGQRFNQENNALINFLYPPAELLSPTRASGRLQVVLATSSVSATLQRHTVISIGLLIVAYFILLTLYILSFTRIKQQIHTTMGYIEKLPEMRFNYSAQNQLHGAFTPIGKALDDCRRDFKHKFEETALENDKLNKVAFHDPLTGFGSPQKFFSKLNQLSCSSKKQLGVLAQIKASELSHINHERGRQAGDEYLCKIANSIRQQLSLLSDCEFFRISSGDFAVYIPNMSLQESANVFERLKTAFNDYQQQMNTSSIAYTGIVPCNTGLDPSAMTTLLDSAVAIAMTQSPNTIYLQEKATDELGNNDHQWREIIERIIADRQISFQQQSVRPVSNSFDGYRELLARFTNEIGTSLPTQTVLAMAARYGLSVELDKMVITSALRNLDDLASLTGKYAINLSGSSIINEEFLAWLKLLLTKHHRVANHLIFEIAENSIQSNIVSSAKFAKLIHALGVKFTIDQFGQGFSSFKFFREVNPDFIKLNSSFTQHIDENGNNRFYVRTLVDISKRSGIQVIATAVERQEEKAILEKMLVDGLQGFYLEHPAPLHDTSMSNLPASGQF